MAKYNELKRFKNEIEKFNNEFLVYENKKIQINTVNSLMNRAIQYNFDNHIEQDENGVFYENDTNSIKLFIELPTDNTTISMEKLLLYKNISGRPEKIEFAFSESLFIIKEVEYHEKTGQISKITFLETEK